MGDQRTEHSQAIHGSQSFPRFGSPVRNRSSSVQKGLVAESANKLAQGFVKDGISSAQTEGMLEKKASANGLVMPTRELSTFTSASEANDDIPIEILSLIDR